jgi:hypothetical protein
MSICKYVHAAAASIMTDRTALPHARSSYGCREWSDRARLPCTLYQLVALWTNAEIESLPSR